MSEGSLPRKSEICFQPNSAVRPFWQDAATNSGITTTYNEAQKSCDAVVCRYQSSLCSLAPSVWRGQPSGHDAAGRHMSDGSQSNETLAMIVNNNESWLPGVNDISVLHRPPPRHPNVCLLPERSGDLYPLGKRSSSSTVGPIFGGPGNAASAQGQEVSIPSDAALTEPSCLVTSTLAHSGLDHARPSLRRQPLLTQLEHGLGGFPLPAKAYGVSAECSPVKRPRIQVTPAGRWEARASALALSDAGDITLPSILQQTNAAVLHGMAYAAAPTATALIHVPSSVPGASLISDADAELSQALTSTTQPRDPRFSSSSQLEESGAQVSADSCFELLQPCSLQEPAQKRSLQGAPANLRRLRGPALLHARADVPGLSPSAWYLPARAGAERLDGQGRAGDKVLGGAQLADPIPPALAPPGQRYAAAGVQTSEHPATGRVLGLGMSGPERPRLGPVAPAGQTDKQAASASWEGQSDEVLPRPKPPDGDPNTPAGREALHEALIYLTTKYYLERGLRDSR